MTIRSVNDVHSMSDLKHALTDIENQDANANSNIIQLDKLAFDDPVLRAMRLRDVAISNEILPFSAPVDPAKEQDFSHVKADAAPFSSKAWVLDNHNPDDTLPQTLDAEMRRLLVLRSYLLLDNKEDADAMGFDAITRLASRMLDCPIALVSLSDIDRQWFLSQYGLGDGVPEISRKNAFCAHCISYKSEDVMVVNDASLDPRFADNPLVTGPLHARFYAGAPLASPEGYKLGTLCVIGNQAKPDGLTLEDKQNLRDLADMVVETMARRRKEKIRAHFHNPKQTIAQMAHELLTPLMGVQLNLGTLSEDSNLLNEMSGEERELLQNALYCSDAVSKICVTAIDELRQQQDFLDDRNGKRSSFFGNKANFLRNKNTKTIQTADLIQAWYIILETFPKNVPVSISLDPSVPKEICIDELKVFRSALNYLSNACQRTMKGSIQLSVKMVTEASVDVIGNAAAGDEEQKDDAAENTTTVETKESSEPALQTKQQAPPRNYLFVECVDTAPNIPVENYPLLFHPSEYNEDQMECIRPTPDGGCEPICRMQTQGLGLYSVAVQIGAIGGEYGYKPRIERVEKSVDEEESTSSMGETTSLQGSIFWFKVPLRND